MNKSKSMLELICIFLIFFAFFGWFMAEQDNEILRQELVSLKHNMKGDH
ncbi:hypothetical protein QWI44_12925 [Acinetobacter pittii]|nr:MULTISPECIES: hypothetical protein [Acinetobacter calcoaceticus/baumannii complex]KCX14489.1 hypothetical protein J723_3234 [Acinetobacter sp. 1264765]MDP7901568.1 hypothetical protein [Acinetobacter pittii]